MGEGAVGDKFQILPNIFLEPPQSEDLYFEDAFI
jgi:hypothetical protein